MRQLLESDSDWPQAHRTVDVIKFYQQHTEPGDTTVGPNTYDALVRSDVFRRVSRVWSKRIALEAAAVKESYCTDDASGIADAVRNAQASIDRIALAGGAVTYFAMDEPFHSGMSARCGGTLDATADRLKTFISALRAGNTGLRVGLIEPYPFFNPAQFNIMVRLMRERGTQPAFLHVDVDLNGLRRGRDAFGRDMIALADVAAVYRIPFGIIIWGGNGNADALYAADARRLGALVQRTFRTWDVMPQHVIFQSWAESSTGQKITPTNLPESRPDTHTSLVNELYRQFRYGPPPPR